ncbi:RagB/SusD family nutrient uptake outer membrane protein [Dyadobacter psychrotolerans]|uniref:RagB/SusD family nutrient uptake outer membrane protein n=1 Tax=Dyadobacter psychrotolerans TaxID=2541721 RepID=A0A4R5DU07_9BACT|nr:RagB/SusD family nutrient uptake outer membrane protein [Dyadobacter psychrotolerans]TDE14665.1 RagB/SusD family nutrient uptake outer membrane protein [Dyadobacter psychrotolerans]
MFSYKFKITSLLAAAGLAIMSSCSSDFIDLRDPNAVSNDTYYRTESDVLAALNGIYQSLRSGNGIGETSALFNEERSDNTGRNDNQSNAGEPFQFNDFSLLPSNAYLKSHWLALYQSISRSNQVLDGIEKVTFTDNNLKEQYKAEAKFIRALTYFHLVRKWGDVPLVTKPLTTIAEVQASTAREKQAVVYQQIVADLKDAVGSTLPNVQTAATKGKVTKAAANALLGQVYLTMATTLDQAGRTANLNEAKTYLTAAYNLRSFGLLKEIPYTDVFDVAKKSTCPEIIFQVVNRQGDINFSSAIARNNQAKGETINSPFTSTGAGGNVTPDLVLDYEETDLRKTFSIKYANDAIVKDYFITKFRDASAAATTNGYGGNDWILIRYADVILMLAEVNMYLGDAAAAIGFLDQVRERAGMPKYDVMKTNAAYTAKYPTLKLAILHERRVELAFENHRLFDLLRSFTTDELVAYFKSKKQADFGIAKLINFGKKDRYYPIPFDEVKLNPEKMYQNEGY